MHKSEKEEGKAPMPEIPVERNRLNIRSRGLKPKMTISSKNINTDNKLTGPNRIQNQ